MRVETRWIRVDGVAWLAVKRVSPDGDPAIEWALSPEGVARMEDPDHAISETGRLQQVTVRGRSSPIAFTPVTTTPDKDACREEWHRRYCACAGLLPTTRIVWTDEGISLDGVGWPP